MPDDPARDRDGTRGGDGGSNPGGSGPSAGDSNSGGGSNGGDDRETAYELLMRGHELLRGRHNAQAAVVLERAARLEPRKGSILEALARAYYDSRQHDRAAETFAALLDVDPSNHNGHHALGLSFERLGRLEEARTHLRLAAAMNPHSAVYRRALERVERRTR
jgi:tetratricopeptide (TPR) repeat protein